LPLVARSHKGHPRTLLAGAPVHGLGHGRLTRSMGRIHRVLSVEQRGRAQRRRTCARSCDCG
jgi:hypothetical protein